MHSPTFANDLCFRLNLTFAPFQRILCRCARCLTSKSRVLTLLRTLFLSLRYFRRSPRLFSITCGLFLQNTGGVGTSATSPRSLRLPALQAGLGVIIAVILSPLYFVAPLFSSTYRSLLIAHRFATLSVFIHLQILFPQLLCIHIYTKPPGVASRLWLSTDSITPAPVAAASSEQSKNSIVTNETLD